MWHVLRQSLLLSIAMPLLAAACSRSSADGLVAVSGKEYRVIDKQRITGPGWTGLAVRYEWDGSEDSAVLNENARRLLTVVGPEALRAGYRYIIFMAVAVRRGTTVNVGYQYVDGQWIVLVKD
jgi:hypothetical protein